MAATTLNTRQTGRGASLRQRLIGRLADGEFHSGARLAAALRVSRTAVWKALHGLSALGLELHSVPKRGYRLPQPIETLTGTRVRKSLAPLASARLRDCEVFDEIASTNSHLFAMTDLPVGRADLCLAEYQSAGRGRRGRGWTAPYGSGLCLSLSWQFAETPRQVGALSLAAGVGVLRALRREGLAQIKLKWPNDIVCEGRKLGGILIELRAESAGPAYVVLGLGLNFSLSPQSRRAIQATGVAPIDLAEIRAGAALPGRNAVAAAIVNELVEALVEFEQRGFQPFMTEWRDADAMAGREVRVLAGQETQGGIARGIDEDGALMLETPTGLKRFVSGEVSMRAAA